MIKVQLLILLCFLYTVPVAQIHNDIPPVTPDETIEIDNSKILLIDSISISGNKKTKSYIILREIHLKPGQSVSLAKLPKELQLARQQVYNTTLFTEVEIVPVITENTVRLEVTVKEKWYMYPVPQFQLVDRNLNEWVVKYKGDLSRVNYGLKFVHYNLSGRRDQIRIFLINGYSRNVSASYVNPYSNAKLTHGYSAGAGFAQTREISYKTNYDNSIARYSNGKFIYDSWNLNAGYILRKAIRERHVFGISFTHLNLRDSAIQKLNPNYFNHPSGKQDIIDLAYSFQYVDVDNILYPLKGTTGNVTLLKRGFGWSGKTNMFSVESEYNKYIDLGSNWYTSYQLMGRVKLPFKQAYINQRSLGFGNTYLRGQEYFAIDAVAFGIAKLNLKKQVARFVLKTPFKGRNLHKIPFRLLAKTYADVGYAYNTPDFRSRLNNKMLYTGGFGIDVITLFDIQFRFEYSFNQLGQNGLFLHNQSGF